MVFRKSDGTHIEILRSSFTTDTAYYNAIIRIVAK
jgi:hypothetical protein